MSERAKTGDTVEVHYRGQLEDGSVFDSSEGREPLQFTLGTGSVIPGFENVVLGMEPGESKTETIASQDAYGPHRPEMVLQLRRNQLPSELDVEVGQELELTDDQGHTAFATVTDVDEKTITLDANHILAGKDLVFTIRLERIVA